jgi:hypothetical protein
MYIFVWSLIWIASFDLTEWYCQYQWTDCETLNYQSVWHQMHYDITDKNNKVSLKCRNMRCVLYTALCDKVCQWFATGQWFSPCTPISSTNKTDRHDIAEILLKVALKSKPNQTISTYNISIHLYLFHSKIIFFRLF